jgi:oligopeptide/dipeptide ABC transporter ATP-binding protein
LSQSPPNDAAATPDVGDLLLDVRGLSTQFATREGVLRAVDGFHLKLERGQTVGLVGESGCGKSMLAYSLLRLVPSPGRVVSGEVFWKGRDLMRLSEEEIRKVRGREIAMVFQEPSAALNPVLTVGEQVAEPLRIHLKMSRREAKDKAAELLQAVRIPDPVRRLQDYPHQMSGGMKQRVLIAMAIACSPDLLIADEPTTALDVTVQAQILDLLSRLKEEFHLSLILISHDLGVVAQNTDRCAVMYAGRIVEEASIRSIFLEPKHPYTEGLLRSIPRPSSKKDGRKRLLTIEGTVPNLAALPPGCAFGTRCPARFGPCDDKPPALLEVAPSHLAACYQYSEPANEEKRDR